MSKPILDPAFWKKRLDNAPKIRMHYAVYRCSQLEWDRMQIRHQSILSKYVESRDSILDAGCAWGRLLGILPKGWQGDYLGIDISPDFIDLAEKNYPQHQFIVGDLRKDIKAVDDQYDWAVVTSVKAMVIREVGQECWDCIESELRRVSKRILCLEYLKDKGTVL